jgi:hypothetical protein
MSELVAKEKEVTILELLDRILNKGVVLWGDVTLSVADVDLIYLGLKVLLTSVETAERMRTLTGWGEPPPPCEYRACPELAEGGLPPGNGRGMAGRP